MDLALVQWLLNLRKDFANFAGVKHAVAVNTGTAALHSAVMACGVKQGDEVILPSFTFVATAEAIVLAGGKPVFADIDPKTYNLSPSAVEKSITKKTKAILPVDLYGFSADMKPMREIAQNMSWLWLRMQLKPMEQRMQVNLQALLPMLLAGAFMRAKTSQLAKAEL